MIESRGFSRGNAKPRAAEDWKEAVLDELGRELARRVAARVEERWKSMPLVEWGRLLLEGYFRLPPSKMHRWLGSELDRLRSSRGVKLNVVGPRGSAKSTLATLAYVLRAAVEGEEPYIWIVSDTKEQAKKLLGHVKHELEQNQALATNYEQAAGRGKNWRSDAIELCNGVVIEAYGTGQHLRGRRRLQHRPSLILCDDLQNDSHINSSLRRSASNEWFHGALMKAGDGETNVVNIATSLHRDALAMELHRSPGWRSGLFKAIETWPERMDLWDEWEAKYTDAEDPDAAGYARIFFEDRRDEMSAGAELLWPEHEGLYALMTMRVDSGRTAFDREKQSSPIDATKCEWPDDYFGHHIWFDKWPPGLKVKVVALDPSKGADARHGDYSAYVLLGIDRHDVLYVEADMERRPTPLMVDDGVRIIHRFRPEALAIEGNLYQELLKGEFQRACREQHAGMPRVEMDVNTVNKNVRIRRIGPLLSQRRVRFLRKSQSTRLLVDQLRDFPLGSHDDGPDALEMAIRLAFELAGVPWDDGLGGNLLGWT